MSKQFIGTGVAVVTPFSENHEIDADALRRVIKHLIEGEVEYLVALGTTGESATLTPDEQDQVLDIFFEEAGNKPILIGAGGNNTFAVCQRVEAITRKYPAAGILSVSPYYNKPTQEGIYQHFKAVAFSTSLPVIIYNVPARTSSNISARTTVSLAHEIPNIVAIKDASGDLIQGMEILSQRPDDFLVLSGDDLLGLSQMAIGYDGVISVSANAFPKDFSRMIRACQRGDLTTAKKLHYKLLQSMLLHYEEGNPAGVKATMELMGICQRTVRLPLIKASEGLVEKMKAHLPLVK